jgi:hypothetical protein
MLISVESKLATYHHVVVVWREMAIDYESMYMYMYPLTMNTLRQICGVKPFNKLAVGMAFYIQKFAKHYRPIRMFRTGAQ